MKVKRSTIFIGLTAILLIVMLASMAVAEDGVLFRRDISKTPDAETEKSAIYMMDFYVPAQASTGLVGPVDNYLLPDGVEAEDGTNIAYVPRDYAKPLVTVWIDDHGGEVEPTEGIESIQGGISFGHFDAFVGVSLDDGTSWRTGHSHWVGNGDWLYRSTGIFLVSGPVDDNHVTESDCSDDLRPGRHLRLGVRRFGRW